MSILARFAGRWRKGTGVEPRCVVSYARSCVAATRQRVVMADVSLVLHARRFAWSRGCLAMSVVARPSTPAPPPHGCRTSCKTGLGVDPVWETKSIQPPRPLPCLCPFPPRGSAFWEVIMARRASRRNQAPSPAVPPQQPPAGAKAPGKKRPQRRVGRAGPAPGLPKSWPQVNLNAAGLDCGATEPFIAVPEDRDPPPVRSCTPCTAHLIALADWLEPCGIDTVAMESTGVYGIPVYERLEARGVAVKRVEPGTLKMIAGRKTEVLDGQGIQQRHTFGLLSGSCRPDDQNLCARLVYAAAGHAGAVRQPAHPTQAEGADADEWATAPCDR